jgi:hypothetical protein
MARNMLHRAGDVAFRIGKLNDLSYEPRIAPPAAWTAAMHAVIDRTQIVHRKLLSGPCAAGDRCDGLSSLA